MSVYAAVNGKIVGQVASNRGWGEFSRWIERQGVTSLRELIEGGFSDRLHEVRDDLADLLRDSPSSDPNVGSTATELLGLLHGEDDDAVLTITDGMSV